ncbi:hypothetical protein [Cognatiluteimonas telluris]|jgi:hypothetical protein|uniref:hypothetical protein n=1 Tax=Cognatiluteimonas telluris TaxID=1104775 RepID=UPI001FAF66B4|nr:hypothetical protein [Lysobacter telluris]
MSPRAALTSRLLLVALLPLGATALAGPRGGDHGGPPSAPRQGQGQDRPAFQQRDNDALSDSVRRIERSTRGQVLSAERVPFDGRDVNRIKTVDSHGRVRVYMDDPQAPHAHDAAAPSPPSD